MKALRLLATAAAIAAISSTAMAADETVVTDEEVSTFSFFKPAAVRAEVGTTGYGGAVSYNVNPKVGITAGYNGGKISSTGDVKIDGSRYNAETDSNNAYLNAEIRPWANWFYVAAGTAYLDNKYDLDRNIGANQEFKINNQTFNLPTATNINGKLDYGNKIAPYLGLGVSPSITSRFGLFGEIGAYYTGNPDVQLNSNSTDIQVQTALQQEARNIANDDKYKWLPVAKAGVSLRF